MKHIIIVLLLLSIPLYESMAQSNGKILITTRDANSEMIRDNKIDSVLAISYNGTIITHFGSLPDSLDQYDAIFTDLRFFFKDDSTFIANELHKLSDFLTTTGKLYIEIEQSTIYEWGNDIYHEYPLFRERTGSIEFGPTALDIMMPDYIIGIPGKFTEPINITRNQEWIPIGYIAVDGNELTTILKTNTLNNIAWVHEKENRKVVYHHPIVKEHYNLFVDMVVCNYFGLCQPLAVKSPTNFSAALVSYNNESREVTYSSISSNHRPISVSVYNLLGAKAFEAQVEGNSAILPKSLSHGCYIVKIVENGNFDMAQKKIMIF